MSEPEGLSANSLRGEVDLELGGTRYVLRPSHEAILEVEKETGKAALALAVAAGDGTMTSREAAVVVTQFIKAWGRATGDESVRGFNYSRVGELIHEAGLMRVVLVLTIVLGNAVTGGCKSDGTLKEGEAMATTTAPEPSPVVASQV